MPVVGGWVGLGAGLDGSVKSRPFQRWKPGPSGPRRVTVPTKLCRPVSICEDERESIVHWSYYIRLVVYRRKTVEIQSYGIFWNIWTAFIFVLFLSPCAATWVRVAFCSDVFLHQMIPEFRKTTIYYGKSNTVHDVV